MYVSFLRRGQGKRLASQAACGCPTSTPVLKPSLPKLTCHHLSCPWQANVDLHPSLVNRFRIAEVPTVLMFRGGKVGCSLVGRYAHMHWRESLSFCSTVRGRENRDRKGVGLFRMLGLRVNCPPTRGIGPVEYADDHPEAGASAALPAVVLAPPAGLSDA